MTICVAAWPYMPALERCCASSGSIEGLAMSGSIPAFLPTDADVYEHFMGRWSAHLAKPFLEFASIEAGVRVLDVGCGTGTLSLSLAQHGTKVVGMDASESYLEGARRRRAHTNVTYEHGDACHL